MFLSLKTLYRKRTVIWPFYFYTIIRTLSRNRQTIKTNINKLIKEDVNIEVEIDIDTGEIVWYIEEDELKKL